MKKLIFKAVYAIAAKLAYQAPWIIVKAEDLEKETKTETVDGKVKTVKTDKIKVIKVDINGVSTPVYSYETGKSYDGISNRVLYFRYLKPWGRVYDPVTRTRVYKYYVASGIEIFGKTGSGDTAKVGWIRSVKNTIEMYTAKEWSLQLVNLLDNYAREYLISVRPETKKEEPKTKRRTKAEADKQQESISDTAWENYKEDDMSAIYNKYIYGFARKNATAKGFEFSFYDYVQRHARQNQLFTPSSYISRFGADVLFLINSLGNLMKINNLGGLTYQVPMELQEILENPDGYWDIPIDKNYRDDNKIISREKQINIYETRLQKHFLDDAYVESQDFISYKEDIEKAFNALVLTNESNAFFIKALSIDKYYLFIDNDHTKSVDEDYLSRTEQTNESLDAYYKNYNRNSNIAGVYGATYSFNEYIESASRLSFKINDAYEHSYNLKRTGDKLFINNEIKTFDDALEIMTHFQTESFMRRYRNGKLERVLPRSVTKDDLLNNDYSVIVEGNMNVQDNEFIRMTDSVHIRKIVIKLEKRADVNSPEYSYANDGRLRSVFDQNKTDNVTLDIKIDVPVLFSGLDLNLTDLECLNYSFVNFENFTKYVKFVDKDEKDLEFKSAPDADGKEKNQDGIKLWKSIITKGGLLTDYYIDHDELIKYINNLISLQLQIILFTEKGINFEEDEALRHIINQKCRLKGNYVRKLK